MNRSKLFLLIFSIVLVSILLYSLPDGANELQPWWLPIILFGIFCYSYGSKYITSQSRLNLLITIFDIFLFLPATFLFFVVFVKLGWYEIPIIFERKAMSPTQLIVVKQNLYTISVQERKVKISPTHSPQRDFENHKNTLLFQLRLMKRSCIDHELLVSQIHSTEHTIHTWEYPNNENKKEQIINELETAIVKFTEYFREVSDKKLLWNWENKKKLFSQTLQKLQAIDLQEVIARSYVKDKFPVPALYWVSNSEFAIFWSDQGKKYRIIIDREQEYQKRKIGEYHFLTILVAKQPYQFEISRYPKYENTYIEEGIKQKAEILIDPQEVTSISYITQYRSFFHRLNILGTTSGSRNQDIFFRLVLSVEQTYLRWPLLWVILSLLVLGSLPILQLFPSCPKILTRFIKMMFYFLQHTTSIPIYALISIVFIGIFDGKNFTSLFICVGYFLLPSFYSEMNNQVVLYRKTYLLAKRGLGFSTKTILFHFIFRENLCFYFMYVLYFLATMILFETSFAFLKGGSPSELSLGIFLHLSQNQWTMETYSCMIVLIGSIYFFCRQASHLARRE